ncbi:MAG: pyridoxal phosphate-dependent decarboxylase family protein [Acidobacteriota bacterium]
MADRRSRKKPVRRKPDRRVAPGKQRADRRRSSRFARRDFDALGTLLDGAVDLVRRWTVKSAGGTGPIFPDLDNVDLESALVEPLPERGRPARLLLADLEGKVLPYLRDNGNPRFFGYVMSPPSAAGIAADLIASAVDQNLTAWRSAPAATELERLVVDWLRQITAMPDGSGGLLTSGGSMANLTALAVARTRHAPPETVRGGLGELGGSLMTVYASDQVHMSIPRAVQLLGLGTAALRTLPTDARLRLDATALEKAIAQDLRRGNRPFCVVASAGTTATGAVDPIERIARVARRHKLWFHVDAAYGGPLRLSPSHRSVVTGLGEADSVSLDPHKWLYAPLDVGCILFRDLDAARGTFASRGDYATVFESGARASFAFFDHGPELSRRFRALKVWMILKYHGTTRIGRRIEEEVELARLLGGALQNQDELELLAPVDTSIVCFRYVPLALRRSRPGARRPRSGRTFPEQTEAEIDRLNENLLRHLQAEGRVYLSNARVHGRFALRACLVNFRTTRSDIHALIDAVVKAGGELTAPAGTVRTG